MKWVRTPDVIRFDAEEEHLVGEETMAVMEIDQAPVHQTELITLENENQIDSAEVTHDIAAISTPPTGAIVETEIQKVDSTNLNEQRPGDESMDVTMDQTTDQLGEEHAPAAAANPDTAAIHESVGVVEASLPEKSNDGHVESPAQSIPSADSQHQLESDLSNPAESPSVSQESHAVPLTTQLESSHPLSQITFPPSTEESESEETREEEEQQQQQQQGEQESSSIVESSSTLPTE